PEVLRLADAEDLAKMPPARIVFLANALRAADEWGRAEEVLRRGQMRHPDDFLLNFTLARVCYVARSEKAADAVRYFTAVLALCPGSAAVLIHVGVALLALGRPEEATAHFRAAVQLKPDFARGHYHLGRALQAAGRAREAVDEFREAAFLRPT